MDLIPENLPLMHKFQWQKLADDCADNLDLLTEVIHRFLNDNSLIGIKSAEVIRLLTDKHPGLVQPHVNQLIDWLSTPVPNAKLRTSVRSLQFLKIPENRIDEVINQCYDLMKDATKPAAIRTFAMTTIYHIVRSYPDLLEELDLEIKEILPHEKSPAFLNRANKILGRSWKF